MYVVRIIPIKREVSINGNNTGKIKFCSENRSIVGWYRTKIEKKKSCQTKILQNPDN